MYRNSASLASGNLAVHSSAPLAAPKPSAQSDENIAELLERKRQQLDAEIEEFRALKEREFQDFERSLRKQKRGRRRGSKGTQNDARPGALSLLNLPVKQQQTNGVSSQQTDNDATPRAAAPLSRPTTNVDKMSISAELPPTPLKSKFSTKSPRPDSQSPVRKKEKSQSSVKRPRIPVTPDEIPSDAFAGVFTPAYLPLLDSRPSTASVPLNSSPPGQHGSFSLPDSASYSSLSPMRRSDRSNTEPAIPSTSLPSALRTASGTVRRRKHVTFKLADSAIVEPSSSYEEMPSPSPKNETGRHSLEETISSDDEVPTSNNGLALAVPSPDLRGKAKRSPDIPGDLSSAIGGGAVGGFFELDEELASPALDAEKPFMDDFDDDSSSPVEARRGDADGKEGLEGTRSRQTYEYSGSLPINIRTSSSFVGSYGH